MIPANNMNNQFEEFMDLCAWLCNEITQDPGMFGRDGYDDPNTVANKLMLALRQLDCRLNFPAQKLRVPHGEVACSVLDFLTEKALLAKKLKWKQPIYPVIDTVLLYGNSIYRLNAYANNRSSRPKLTMMMMLEILLTKQKEIM